MRALPFQIDMVAVEGASHFDPDPAVSLCGPRRADSQYPRDQSERD